MYALAKGLTALAILAFLLPVVTNFTGPILASGCGLFLGLLQPGASRHRPGCCLWSPPVCRGSGATALGFATCPRSLVVPFACVPRDARPGPRRVGPQLEGRLRRTRACS